MSHQLETDVRVAAIDTLTIESASSVFSPDGQRLPWARECLIIYIDLVINYDEVLRPLPHPEFEPEHRQELTLNARGKGEGWLRATPVPGSLPKSIELLEDDIEELFRVFELVLLDRQMQTLARRLIDYMWDLDPMVKAYDNLYDGVDAPLGTLPRQFKQLSLRTNIEPLQLSDLFMLFARTYQYYAMLGKRALYVPHPFRRGAFASMIKELPTDGGARWSWGRYFVWLLEQQNWEYSDLIGHIKLVRDEVQRQNATWHNRDLWNGQLTSQQRALQADTLTSIAVKLPLPAELSEKARRRIERLPLAISLLKATTGLDLEVVSAGAQIVVPLVLKHSGRFGPGPEPIRLDTVRQWLEWPGLISEV